MAAPIDVDVLIDRQNIWRTMTWVLIWAAAAMVADGYDLLSISYVAPHIIREWGITRASFGPAFSIANLASMLGGIIAGYLADWMGRKKMIVLGTVVLGCSTLGTALAHNLHELLTWRAIAGFGLGGVPPIAIVMVNEYAPQRLRATIVAALYLGNSIGSMLASLVAATLIAGHGWQIVFIIGGLAPLAISVGLGLFLPESLRFLVTQRPGSPQIAKIAARLAPASTFAPDSRFIMRGEPPVRGIPLRLLFADGRWAVTLLFWLAYFASGLTLYTMTSWSPTILESIGLSSRQAALTAGGLSIAGWLGGVVITRFMDRFGLIAMAIPPLIGFPLIAGLGYLGGAPEALIVTVSLLCGMAYSGGHAGLHATGGLIYPTAIRANGVALGLSVTRLAGVVAPTVAGFLFSGNGAARQVLWLTAAPLLVVSACYIGLGRLNPTRLSNQNALASAAEAAL